jgi:hypothetical protein
MNNIIIHMDWKVSIDKFTIEEKALFLDLIYAYYSNTELPVIPDNMVRLDMFWDQIVPFLDRKKQTYQKRVDNTEKARSNNPKTRLDPPAGPELPTQTYQQVINDNDNDKGKDKDKDKVKVKTKWVNEALERRIETAKQLGIL